MFALYQFHHQCASVMCETCTLARSMLHMHKLLYRRPHAQRGWQLKPERLADLHDGLMSPWQLDCFDSFTDSHLSRQKICAC
mmetsp:Transcript_15685/g.25487  ORF Transcript_15685/g.25487 Transcript_15685/m.25487 type:complete len:82 (-) Transcript_15685:43-288(-)